MSLGTMSTETIIVQDINPLPHTVFIRHISRLEEASGGGAHSVILFAGGGSLFCSDTVATVTAALVAAIGA